MGASKPVAVLLNANANRVNGRVLRVVRDLVDRRDIFVSRSAGEAEEAARTVIERGYPIVCTGGGDGTLVQFVTSTYGYLAERGHDTPPDIGVLKLGTGNAIASFVGASKVEEDLRRIRSGEALPRFPLPLVEVEGRLAHFAGVGLDAAILNDYHDLKDTWIGRRLKYFASVVGKSLPLQFTTRLLKPLVRVYNLGSPAWRCGPNGEAVGKPIPAGGLLYDGPVTLAGVSTTPFYGYGMRIYPFAGKMPNRVELRVACSGTLEIVGHLRSIWNGTYRSPTIQDFWVDAVRLEFSKPVPFQVGGDAVGYREEMEFRLSSKSVRLVDLHRPAQETLH